MTHKFRLYYSISGLTQWQATRTITHAEAWEWAKTQSAELRWQYTLWGVGVEMIDG